MIVFVTLVSFLTLYVAQCLGSSVFSFKILATSPLNTAISSDTVSMHVGKHYAAALKFGSTSINGDAVGCYASYVKTTLTFTSAAIYKQADDFMDVAYTSDVGVWHIVLAKNINGFYSYFVNSGLPSPLGEFRTVCQIDGDTFRYGRTSRKVGELPTYPDDYSGTKVQDETWELSNGSYITKYDWSSRIQEEQVYGVYGDNIGMWVISPSTDYYNGDNQKQELMLHTSGSNGNTVLLNMLHGTHYAADISDTVPTGKMWGPWLWYFNEGSYSDAQKQLSTEKNQWPYSWIDDTDYQSRGIVTGTLKLSNGSAASHVNVFLGDEGYSMTQGVDYYYNTKTDGKGNFQFKNVRTEKTYYLQAYPSYESKGSPSANQIDTYEYGSGITVTSSATKALGTLSWAIPTTETVWQIGVFDRTSKGFDMGDSAYEHGKIEKCAADLTYTVGTSTDSDWCFGKSKAGTWTVKFTLDSVPTDSSARIYVSIAGYSGQGTSIGGVSSRLQVSVNSEALGTDLNKNAISSDPSTYRSSTFGGQWWLAALDIDSGLLVKGDNTVTFTTSKYSENHGWIWDSVKLVWVNP